MCKAAVKSSRLRRIIAAKSEVYMLAIFVLNNPDKFPQIDDKFIHDGVRKKAL